jgi:hypothetical protein
MWPNELLITWQVWIMKLSQFFRFLPHRLGSYVISLRLRILELRMFLVELRMSLNRAHVFLLKRDYQLSYEGDLAPNLMFWCRAAIYHPVEVVQVFCDSFHSVGMWPNVES